MLVGGWVVDDAGPQELIANVRIRITDKKTGDLLDIINFLSSWVGGIIYKGQ